MTPRRGGAIPDLSALRPVREPLAPRVDRPLGDAIPLATLAIVAMDKVDAPVVPRAPLAPWVKVVAGVLILTAFVLAAL